MIHCNSCGKENAASFDYCLDCGHDLRAAPPANVAVPRPTPTPPPVPLTRAVPEKRCPSCDTPAPGGFAFCGSCGARLAGPEAPSPVGATLFAHGAPATASRRRARLVSVQPDGSEGLGFALDADETVAGSAQGAIRFADDPYVSPRHCRFYWAGDALHVEDLGSLNGVFRKVRGEVELRAGDHLRLGRQLLRIEPMLGSVRARTEATRIWGSHDPGYQARLLQILQGGSVGEVFPLAGGDNLLGREQGDVTFPTDRFVSGRHAVITVEAARYAVRDLGSSNGTFVRLTRATPLDAGDFLLIGNQLLRLDPR